MASSRKFVILDGLRGIAALMIVTRHSPALFGINGPWFESYLAVDFFFLLSGFVLAHAYAEKLATGMTVRRFMAIRLIRLYPLYALALLIAIPDQIRLLWHAQEQAYEICANVISAALFVPSPFAGDLFPLNVPAWSLFFEIIANFMFAVTWPRMTQAALVGIVIAVGCILVGSVSAGLFGFNGSNGAMNAGIDWQTITAGLIRVTFSFFAGLLLYVIWKSREWPTLSPLYAVAAFITILALNPPVDFGAVYDLFAVIVAFPTIVILGAASKSHIGDSLMSLLGITSYAIYILSTPLISAVWIVLYKAEGALPELTLTVIAISLLGAILIAALAADYFFDTPLRRLLMKSFMPHPTRPDYCHSMPDRDRT